MLEYQDMTYFTLESHEIDLFFNHKTILEFMSQIEYTLKAMINYVQLVLRETQLGINEESEQKQKIWPQHGNIG